MQSAPRYTRPLAAITPLFSFIIHHSSFILLILLAIYPLLTSGLPTTGDGLNHFYRLAELEWHIRHGDLYPRWFANLGYGFGIPLFNFYSPLSYYLALIFRLFGFSLATSLQLSYALALALATLGAYKWAAELFTLSPPYPHTPALSHLPAPTTRPPDYSTTRLLTAAAYGLAPYFYFNIFHRGAYPETWALALAPWLLWSVHRLAAKPTSFFIFHFSFFISAIILTHTLSALILIPVAAFYALGLLWSQRNSKLALRLLGLGISRAFRGLCLGFGVCSFFTLPILLESQFIQLSRAYSTGDLDYHNHFLTLASLFSPPPNFDPHLVFNSMPPSLGWPQAALALIAALLSLRHRTTRSTILGIGILEFGISLFTLSLSEPLWNLLPVSRLIQFPWRLVGPASLFLAALAGSVALPHSNNRSWDFGISRVSRGLCLAFGILSFFFFSLPWTYHADFSLQSPVSNSPLDTINYELASGQLGTASTAEYLPRWVAEIPNPNTLLPLFAAAEQPSRLASLPDDVSFDVSRLSPTSEQLTYTSPSPFTATFNLFYFPGWVAEIDGQRAEIQPSTPQGLVTVLLPAGFHTLRLYRTLTPPQLIGALISLISLISLIAYALARRNQIARFATLDTQYVIRDMPHTSRLPFVVSAFLLALLLSRPLYLDRTETIFHHTDTIPNPISVNFDNQLELIGYDYAPASISNHQLPITIYWRAISPLNTNYSTSVQLADRFGNRFGQSDSQHPNGVPTSRWTLDQYARDSHNLLSLAGTPPGNYQLLITVYSDHPLSILQDGAPVGVEYELGTVTVARAEPQPPGPLRLVEFDLASDTVAVGDQLAFTVLWSSGDKTLPNLTAAVLLADNSGQTLFREGRPPAGPDYPSGQWQLNELIRYPFSITLPPELPGGAAHVRLSLTDADGVVAAGPYDLGTILVTVPERSFDILPMQTRVDHDFGDAIRLLGYDVEEGRITLYWQSLKAVSQRLTVFVHALDEVGAFVSGHDAAPARPTTGWLAGEVIADVHPIAVGEHFEIGLYDPITGERFGETFITRR
jgi:hypothetical protein